MPGPTSRPSNPFPSACRRSSRRLMCRYAVPLWPGRLLTVCARLLENGNEHRRNILQAILRFRVLEQRGVLSEFVRYLIDDEAAARRERVVGFPQERPFFVDLQNAERDAGEDVVAVGETETLQFLRKPRRITMNDVDPGIISELPFQIARESRIQFEQKQVRVNAHPAGDPARVDTFAR